MLATAPQLHNRIASHFAPTPNPVPAKPDAKAAWGDAVFAAMMFYQSQLMHPDERVAERAAKAIFDLEKTRLRHGGHLAGASASKTEDTSRSRRDAQGRIDPTSTMEPPRDLARIEEPEWEDESAGVGEVPAEFDEKERAAIDAMVRHERYAPMIEELRAKLVSQGAKEDDARTMATEALRQHVGQAILERRSRGASPRAG